MTKNFLFFLFLLSLALFSHAQTKEMFPDGSRVYLWADKVNLRSSPSKEGEVVANLRISTPVKILDKSGERYTNDNGVDMPWYLVEFEKEGKKQKGYVWGGLLSIVTSSWQFNGTTQYLLVGMDSYESPGLFGGGFMVKGKWVENNTILSSVVYEADFDINFPADESHLMVDLMESKLLDNMGKIFLVYDPDNKYRVPSKSVLFIANSELHHFRSVDSIFVPEDSKGKKDMLVVEFYDNNHYKNRPILLHEHAWNGIGLPEGERTIFRDQVKLYAIPDTNASVLTTLHFDDMLTVYRNTDNEKVDKGLSMQGLSMSWVLCSIQKENQTLVGYIWYGDFSMAEENIITHTGKTLKIRAGLKKKLKYSTYVLEVKIALDDQLLQTLPFTFISVEEQSGPYIFPDIQVINKKLGSIQHIVHLHRAENTEGSDVINDVYLFYDGIKFHSIQIPPDQSYDLKYEIAFPEDKGGEDGKVIIYKLTGWEGENRSLYKKYTWDGISFK